VPERSVGRGKRKAKDKAILTANTVSKALLDLYFSLLNPLLCQDGNDCDRFFRIRLLLFVFANNIFTAPLQIKIMYSFFVEYALYK
jgi:hypothetical protein